MAQGLFCGGITPNLNKEPYIMPTDMHRIKLHGVSKTLLGIRALEGVDFTCRKGSGHAVLGENGAGIPTLTTGHVETVGVVG